MEYINKVELAGNVISCRKQDVANTQVAYFTLQTARDFASSTGATIVDYDKHSCVAWQSDKINLSKIKEGGTLHIEGRLKYIIYTTPEGTTEKITNIAVSKIY